MRRLIGLLLAIGALVPSAGFAHVLDDCAGTDHCNYWESGDGRCHRAEKAEISDGQGGGGFTRFLIRTRQQNAQYDISVQCSPAWYLIAGKHKFLATIWKRTFVRADKTFEDTLCHSTGWVTNTSATWQMQFQRDYRGGAPCGAGNYFVAVKASIFVDWANAGRGAWTVDHPIATRRHYWYS